MEWSPQDAMKAYLQTLHLCKADDMQNKEDKFIGNGRKSLINQQEGIDIIGSQGLELTSALAAGNQARVLVEITTSNSKQGISPLTIALAVAAKQTGGKLICILPSHDRVNFGLRRIKERLSFYGLASIIHHDHDHDHQDQDGVIELRVGDPYEQIRDVKNIDFAVIDCKFDHNRLRSLYEKLHLNPKGAIVVANNVLHRRHSVTLVDQVLKGNIGVESSVTTLPFEPAGIQVIIRIKPMMIKKRRHKRFLVTFDG